MTHTRDAVIRRLWRGHDPLSRAPDTGGPADLQGWGSQHRYLGEAVERLRPSVVVEIGVWKGASVVHMASRMRDLGIDGVVIAIDTWLGAWDHWINDKFFREVAFTDNQQDIYSKFLNNIRHAGLQDYVVPLRLDSVNAARVLRRFDIKPDLVHLDAGHDYDAVMSDLRHWWPALRPGGIFIGDDYREGNNWPDVKRAFDDFFEPLGLTPIENTSDKCRLVKPEAAAAARLTGGTDFPAIARAVTAWRESCRIAFGATADDESIGFWERIDQYIRFAGPTWNGIRLRAMNRIVRALNEQGIKASRNDVFGSDFEIRADVLRNWLPDAKAAYPRPAAAQDLARFDLLPPSPNPYAARALPRPIDKHMGRAQRPALALYKVEQADLFVTPLGYQLFDARQRTYWPIASTRAYSDQAIEGEHVTVRQPVVIVQDVFEGTNFSHFLFDWMPRLCHFVAAEREQRDACVFLMGGAPGELHALILDRVCALYGLKREQFIFPTGPQVWHIEAPVYFFSDLKTEIMQPAHMAHDASIAVIRAIAAGIAIPRGHARKVYISRGDTGLRKLANEDALWAVLQAFGFVMVRLADMQVAEQIEVVRGAEVIVAPHGMGLTHIAFHPGGLTLIELHNASIGTDIYAFMAHALGFRYRAVFGTDIGNDAHDFVVDPGAVANELAAEALAPGPAAAAVPALPSRWHAGVQSQPATPTHDVAVPAGAPPACKHVRDDPARQPDTNMGWLEVGPVPPGTVCHGACDVWIPSDFAGTAVLLECGSFGNATTVAADLGRRETWQTISVAGTALRETYNIVLRPRARAGDVLYSRRWRTGPGATPGT